MDLDLERREVDMSRIEDIVVDPDAGEAPQRADQRGLRRPGPGHGRAAGNRRRCLGRLRPQRASHTIGGYLTLPVPVLGSLIAKAFADGNRDEMFADKMA